MARGTQAKGINKMETPHIKKDDLKLSREDCIEAHELKVQYNKKGFLEVVPIKKAHENNRDNTKEIFCCRIL